MSSDLNPRIVEVTLRLAFDRPVSDWVGMILAQQAIPKEIALTPKKDGDPTRVQVLSINKRRR